MALPTPTLRPAIFYIAIISVSFLLVLIFIVIAQKLLSSPDRVSEVTSFSVQFDTQDPNKLLVTNSANDAFYACSMVAKAKGTMDQYSAFFKNFTYKNCKAITRLRPQWECIVSNQLQKQLKYTSARTLEKLPGPQTVSVKLDQFYQEETRPERSFLSTHTPQDLYSLTLQCSLPNGADVGQEIILP